MPEQILIVDDEAEIADLIELYLKNENYAVHKFYTAREALACVETEQLDLAILDIMLPDMSGFDLCRRIREKHTYPVIMLTAKDGEMDKITGLTLGADDYITKPFRPLEMVARVKAQLRRYKKYNPAHGAEEAGEIMEHAGLVLNAKTHECLLDEQPLALTPTKNNNTITVHIRHLREKLRDSVEHPRFIKTIWGVGYKIETHPFKG